ncbi:Calvin cycle protein CP12 [Gloeocapsopsis dulcis]|uniref:CP12 domain-containing protein n=1 Tax=Gloeocapsopsis dulcis AAB1 = 1H9 TaxID=1433147 RepID=A0A6N8FTV7_9CHRO|nr:Calvin cycle protein CP12 [Gloeocapsopsis dulcis]MUL36012.1 hypothetical protein [Gloeocapsopsis dulcis AAB1 = 1H9]WNN88265.1 Calvin cycle protein CP12 [Gloeocapsopsis dulcis]
MVYVTKELTATVSTPHVESKKSLETSFQAALEHARRLTQMYGIDTPEVAVAWDTVEELITAIAAKDRQRETPTSAFAKYCALYPEAPECRLYDV